MDNELDRIPLGDGTELFRMSVIEVDGIKQNCWKNNGIIQPMFQLKENDHVPIDYSAAYIPVSYKDGDINEEAWLKHGAIVGRRSWLSD